ncbi:GntG family PLP-dependent aldolase [Clostridium sp. YIM B02500]|uniref:threonine aldolase family protein n=1 Tax=Clostridium sp. YIM B02500 TaxID=2910681 RepID=UPI001EEDB4F4|nr:GntG family PLP-dependent aldolase [Clostridium sp. YIM B02500]
MNSIIDYRSDAVTLATFEMRQAMANAEVGDDFAGEDPTVNRLEKMSASLFNKEAAMFVISGTMANQIAIMATVHLGDEVLVGEESHIYNLENGGLAALSGVQARPLKSYDGMFDLNDIKRAVEFRGIQSSSVKVLCLENTYDLNRGIPLTETYISSVSDTAHKYDMMVYLDGARIFNAAAALNEKPSVLCKGVDVMQFSLCKGLSAPVGCMLLGSKKFIERARVIRHRIGGAMAQAGHMAAAGIVALETMVDRIQDDHLNAKRLAVELTKFNESLVDVEKTLTNIVQINLNCVGKDAFYLDNALQEYGVKVKVVDSTTCRLVTHYGINVNDIDHTIYAIKSILS